MFQFDEDWDPEEERRDQEEYRRVLQAHGQQQQVDNQKRDGNEQPRSSSFYDDYFALDPAQCEWRAFCWNKKCYKNWGQIKIEKQECAMKGHWELSAC